jgi:hypothetical protein
LSNLIQNNQNHENQFTGNVDIKELQLQIFSGLLPELIGNSNGCEKLNFTKAFDNISNKSVKKLVEEFVSNVSFAM